VDAEFRAPECKYGYLATLTDQDIRRPNGSFFHAQRVEPEQSPVEAQSDFGIIDTGRRQRC